MAQIEHRIRIEIAIEPFQIDCAGKQRIVTAGIDSRNRQILQVRRIGQIDRRRYRIGGNPGGNQQLPHVRTPRQIERLQLAAWVQELDRKRSVAHGTSENNEIRRPFQTHSFESGVVAQIEIRDVAVAPIQFFEISEIFDPFK